MTTAMTSLTSDSKPSNGNKTSKSNTAVPVGLDLRKVKGTKENQQLLAYCDSLFNTAKDARVQFERQWYLNMAFYFGRHYAGWITPNSSSNFARLYEPPVPPWRVRLVVNKVRAIVRTELAKITKERPRGFVLPSTSDDDDLFGARAGEAIYDHLYRELKLAKINKQSVFWTLLCGSGFQKDFYDNSQKDTSGQQGKIVVENVTPFHLFVPEVAEEDIENQSCVIHSMVKTKDWVKQAYDVDVPPNSTNVGGTMEDRFLGALGIQTGVTKNAVAIKEAWIKPCSKFKDGALIIWSGEEVLAMTDSWPLEQLEYPFAKFDHIPTGRFYGDSTIVDLIPLQKEYNRTRSQIIEAQNRMAKPQLTAPRGSLDPSKITSEPGLVVLYTPGFNKPEPLPLQPLPAYVNQNLQQTQQDMNDISSQHEISRGSTPPGVEAASAISYLQEEDDTKLKTTVDSLEAAVEKVGRHILIHVQQNWEAQRQVKVTGVNDSVEVFAFNKSDLRDNTDFRIESGSALPISRAAKQAFIMELGKMQWISPSQAMRYLDMAETGRLYEETMIDVRQAQRENLMFSKGVGDNITVNAWDEHAVHIKEHDNFRKKQSYDALDQRLKLIIENHVQVHKQSLCNQYGRSFHAGDPQMDGFIRAIMSGQVIPPAAQPQQPQQALGPPQQAQSPVGNLGGQ